MSPDEIFEAALKRPRSERSAFVELASTGRVELVRQINRLLEADAAAGSFLDEPGGHPETVRHSRSYPSGRIGTALSRNCACIYLRPSG